MKLKLLLLKIFIICAIINVSAKPVICLIKGSIVNRDSKAIILMKATDDPRTSLRIRIPITNNTFQYKFTAPEQEAYKLIFEEELEASGFKPVIFFPDTSIVQLTLHDMGDAEEKNKISGGSLNRSYYQFLAQQADAMKSQYLAARQKRRDAVEKKLYYTPAFDSLQTLLGKASTETRKELSMKLQDLEKSGNGLTPAGIKMREEERAIITNVFKMRYAYIPKQADAAAYYMLYDDARNIFGKDEFGVTGLITDAYAQLAKKMPNHPYTKKLGYTINSLRLLPGQPFVDFAAPDLNGKSHQLSALIKGKVTLLDLWASWCGPCIVETRKVVPVYEEFKDKGFQMVGIAREFKDLTNLKIALAREKYPWINLVDLEGKLMVWDKYGFDTGGGGMVLFDQDGKILARNPTSEALKEILKKTLK